MTILLADIEALGAGDALLHVGPGSLQGLTRYPATAARVVLVEADPACLTGLQARTAHLPEVRILDGAFGPAEETPVLRRFSLPRFNGIGLPSGLLALYPGLRQHGQVPVHRLSAAQVAEALGPASGRRGDVLVIETPAQVLPILAALEAGDLLDRFARIRAVTGAVPLVDGAATHDEIAAWLLQRGWEVAPADPGGDPDLPLLVAHAGGLPLAGQARESLALLQAERDELQRLIGVCDAERQEMVRQLGDSEAEREALRARAEVADRAEALAAELALREEELAAARAETEALRAELAAITPSDELRAQLSAAQERAAEMSRTMLSDQRMALRLQASLQADLKALQDRYATLLEEKEARDRLLMQVTRRLGDAAEFLKALPDPDEVS